ncbi:hypothetical protein BTS2_0750 [Bacillus sp. TS-2]|nr:hypothetical protein BTS2_0750 [Bacillus sp. TS-2]
MKLLKKVGLFLGILLFFQYMNLSINTEAAVEWAESIEYVESYEKELVAENSELMMFVNMATYELAIIVKETGDIWFSNPPDKDADSIAVGISREQLYSQFSLTYFNRNAQELTMNSYSDSVEKGQAEMEVIENGIRVNYTVGEEVSGYLIPQIISQARMEPFISEMSAEEAAVIQDIYSLNEDEEIFVLRSGTAVFIQEDAESYFKNAGYSIEDYYQDNEENEVEGAGGAVFTIPVEYRLENEHFLVTIPVDEVINSELYTLTDIRLLEYFGTANLEDEGYLFVPDGSGALINLNNDKTSSTAYVSNVYGMDETRTYNQVTNRDKKYSAKLPVFGLKKEGSAFLAIIEDGETYASVFADIAGKTDSYNKAFADFSYLPYGRSSLDNMTGSGILQLYQSEPYQGNFQVRYGFLSGEEATYSGMAQFYQDYLVDKGVLSNPVKEDSLPFYLGVIGGVHVTKSFLGIPYQGIEPLTNFSQMKDLVDGLLAENIDHLKIKLEGWFNGGVHHYSPNKIQVLKEINSELSLIELQEYMNQINTPIYYDVDFGYVYDEKSFDGFSSNRQATRYFDNQLVSLQDYNLATRRIDSSTSSRFILNSSHLNEVTTNFLDSARNQDLSLDGLSLRTITSTVSSDFSRRNFIDRQSSKDSIEEAMKRLESEDIQLMGVNSNAYAFDYVLDILETPMNSNQFAILDEDIPFYQLVINGYISYSGDPLNLSDNYENELLKTIETGAGLYYQWIYESDSLLKETDFDHLYSVNAHNWFEEAITLYHEINQRLQAIHGQKMVEHQKVLEQVYKVTYENGVTVYVNYSNEEVMIDQVVISAKDFAVEERDDGSN